jgi:hypothetical protein
VAHYYSRLVSDVPSLDRRGLLEGGQLVRRSILPSELWYCEQQMPFRESDHRCLRPIVTTPLATLARPFEDWTILSHPASHSIHIHIYDGERVRIPGSESMVRFHASSILCVSYAPVLGRTSLRRRQHPSVPGIMYHTPASSGSTTIYSSAYSTVIDWTRIAGITDWGGASFLVFVADGGTSFSNSHPPWVCIFYARTAPPPWTR